MATDRGSSERDRVNLLEQLLEEAREQYAAEHGEAPPEGFDEEARTLLLRTLAKQRRDEHRDVYDALAEE